MAEHRYGEQGTTRDRTLTMNSVMEIHPATALTTGLELRRVSGMAAVADLSDDRMSAKLGSSGGRTSTESSSSSTATRLRRGVGIGAVSRRLIPW